LARRAAVVAPAPTMDPPPEGGESPKVEEPAAAEPPPPAPLSDHQLACQRLWSLVCAAEPAPEYELRRALQPVIAADALAHVSIHMSTEAWLASLICERAPRADCLVEPVAAAFGWTPDAIGGARQPVAGAIWRLKFLRQRRSLAILRGLMNAADQPNENQLFAALDAVITPEVIDDPVLGPKTHASLAKLLAETAPRSDAVLRVVVPRLRWEAIAQSADADPAIKAAVLRRNQLVRPRGQAPRAARRNRAPGFFFAMFLLAVVVGAMGQCTSALTGMSQFRPTTVADARDPYGPPAGVVVIMSTEEAQALLQCQQSQEGQLSDCHALAATTPAKGDIACDIAELRTPMIRGPDGQLIVGAVVVPVRFTKAA
jgi:hypothetical protein